MLKGKLDQSAFLSHKVKMWLRRLRAVVKDDHAAISVSCSIYCVCADMCTCADCGRPAIKLMFLAAYFILFFVCGRLKCSNDSKHERVPNLLKSVYLDRSTYKLQYSNSRWDLVSSFRWESYNLKSQLKTICGLICFSQS